MYCLLKPKQKGIVLGNKRNHEDLILSKGLVLELLAKDEFKSGHFFNARKLIECAVDAYERRDTYRDHSQEAENLRTTFLNKSENDFGKKIYIYQSYDDQERLEAINYGGFDFKPFIYDKHYYEDNFKKRDFDRVLAFCEPEKYAKSEKEKQSCIDNFKRYA